MSMSMKIPSHLTRGHRSCVAGLVHSAGKSFKMSLFSTVKILFLDNPRLHSSKDIFSISTKKEAISTVEGPKSLPSFRFLEEATSQVLQVHTATLFTVGQESRYPHSPEESLQVS